MGNKGFTATYTATVQSPTGAEEDLPSRIRGIIDERDTYRAKCARQDAILAKLAALMGELQEFIEFIDATPQKLEANNKTARAKEFNPDDETVARWAAEHSAGASCAEIAKRYGVSKFRIAGHISQWRQRQRKSVKVEPTLEPISEPETETKSTPLVTLLDLPLTAHYADPITDNTIAEWTRLIDSGRTAEWIGDQYDVDPFLVRGLVRGWREEHGETAEAFGVA
jgi:hypothetical protein